MKERWILTGKYFNGDEYFEVFMSLGEALEDMNFHRKRSETLSIILAGENKNTRSNILAETVNPLTLNLENDNSKEDIPELTKELYPFTVKNA